MERTFKKLTAMIIVLQILSASICISAENAGNTDIVLKSNQSTEKRIAVAEEGEYELTKSIDLFSGVRLYGINRPVLKVKFNGNGLNISSCSDVVVGNFIIDCNVSENSGGEGISVFGGSHNVTLEYIFVR